MESLTVLLNLNPKNLKDLVKHSAYYALSMLSLNNPITRNLIFLNIPRGIDGLIQNLLFMFIDDCTTLNVDSPCVNEHCLLLAEDNNWQLIENRITAGKALAAFCYLNSEFRDYIVQRFDKLEWIIFEELFVKLDNFERKFKNEYCQLCIQKAKCFLALQVGMLHELINFGKTTDQDPRAFSITILIDLVRSSTSSYLRSIILDSICCLMNSDRTLVKALVAIDSVEIISSICFGIDRNRNFCEHEIANASIALKTFAGLSADARRRILRLARTDPSLMEMILHYNEKVSLDLLNQWNHYQKLLKITKRPYTFWFDAKSLPNVSSKVSTKSFVNSKEKELVIM